MKNLKPIDDRRMARYYKGTECFKDGTNPLLAELKKCNILVCEYKRSSKNESVLVGVYPTDKNCSLFFEGFAENKEQGVDTAEQIAEHIIKTGFDKDDFMQYFIGLDLYAQNIDKLKKFFVQFDNY